MVRSSSGGGVAHILLFKQVFDHLRLLLSPKEMASDRRHHLVAGAGSTLAERIGFHILIQQLVGVEFGAVARQLN